MAAAAAPRLDEVVSFVKDYYRILNKHRAEAHNKYAETSKLMWPGGSVTTTLSSIKDKILSSDYRNCRAVYDTPFVPATHLGGVFVAVRGKFVGAGVVRADFFQTFLVCAKQEKEEKKGALYILIDYLQVLDGQGEGERAAAAAPAAEASAFVREYYKILNESRERAHKLYAEWSTLRWPDRDGLARPVTAPRSKNDKILSSDYRGCSAEVVTLAVPASRPEAAFVAVRGRFLDDAAVVRAHFFQNFVLSKDNKGLLLIRDDYLHVVDEAKKSESVVVPRAVAPKQTTPTPEAREVFLVNLPAQVTQHDIAECMKEFFGPVRRPAANSVKIATRDNSDGSFTFFALVEFQSPDSARQAVEARVVCFGKKEASIVYKKAGVSVPPELTTKVFAPKSAVYLDIVPEAAAAATRGVFVACLPREATKNMVAQGLRKFGPVRRQPNAVQIKTTQNKNGSYTTNARVEFESPDSALLAVEARFVKFGEKVAVVQYNKPWSW